MLYVRSDLYDSSEEVVRRVKASFVEIERLGFRSQETYNELAAEVDVEPDLGD